MSSNLPDIDTSSVVIAWHAPAVQIDFSASESLDPFGPSAVCSLHGDEDTVGIKFCLSQSNASPGSFDAGVIACPQGISANGICSGAGEPYNISIRATLFTRTATSILATSNKTILAVTDLGTPTKVDSTTTEPIHAAMDWLLNHTAAGLPLISSPTFLFWNRNGLGGIEYGWSIEAYKTLKSMLTFIFWEFNTNNWGNPDMAHAEQGPDGTVTFLPAEFHVMSSTGEPLTRFVIDTTMFVLYIVFQGIPICFCWAVLGCRYMSSSSPPATTAFPLLDMVFKAELAGKPILQEEVDRLIGGQEKDFIQAVDGVKIIAKGKGPESKR
ncbi:hypothetical protein BDV96DRAFT_655307 [Lophiotrema nucula]|uniref:Uncharacterized protein n=1 Tax=Lophiotrema nucula TaxID=690887 RepID=A0A6A5YGA3_9PLEO|nr:hypothetical protein BDV96DRAFT_655307 [Lophiotrema nucula]